MKLIIKHNTQQRTTTCDTTKYRESHRTDVRKLIDTTTHKHTHTAKTITKVHLTQTFTTYHYIITQP